MRRPEPEEILDWSAKTGEPAKFKGSEVFRVLWKKGKIIPHHTVVRVIRGGQDTEDHEVNRIGLLISVLDKSESAIRPEDVLSKEKSPEGWHIYKFLQK